MTKVPKINGDRKKYLKDMQHRPCLICDTDQDVVGHHVYHDRSSDEFALPLCQEHHSVGRYAVHYYPGGEGAFWVERAPEIVKQAMKLWAQKYYEDNHNEPG